MWEKKKTERDFRPCASPFLLLSFKDFILSLKIATFDILFPFLSPPLLPASLVAFLSGIFFLTGNFKDCISVLERLVPSPETDARPGPTPPCPARSCPALPGSFLQPVKQFLGPAALTSFARRAGI